MKFFIIVERQKSVSVKNQGDNDVTIYMRQVVNERTRRIPLYKIKAHSQAIISLPAVSNRRFAELIWNSDQVEIKNSRK